jgi:hypothetical protein
MFRVVAFTRKIKKWVVLDCDRTVAGMNQKNMLLLVDFWTVKNPA